MNQFCEIGYYHYAHLVQVFQYLIFFLKKLFENTHFSEPVLWHKSSCLLIFSTWDNTISFHPFLPPSKLSCKPFPSLPQIYALIFW